jgi:hypothetical protein
MLLITFFFFFFGELGFEHRALWGKAGAFLLKPYRQSILLWLFWRWGSSQLFGRAGLSNHDPPISACEVARITGTSLMPGPNHIFFFSFLKFFFFPFFFFFF